MAAIHIYGQDDPTPRATISRLTLDTMREYTGHEPLKARTTITDDFASVIVEDTLLPAEQALVEQGDGDAVLVMRRKYQQAMRKPLVEGVQRVTGRRVAAFFSDDHLYPHMAVEMFVFEDWVQADDGSWQGAAASN